MLSEVQFKGGDKLLDLGWGYGFVAIYASNFIETKNIIMCDISNDAVNLSKKLQRKQLKNKKGGLRHLSYITPQISLFLN